MLRYIQRSEESLSSRSVPGYFDGALRLHRAKTECFLSLSAGTTAEERQAFVFRDLAGELRIAIKRFQKHPGELAENLPSVNAALFSTFPTLKAELLRAGIQSPDDWVFSQEGQETVMRALRL